MTTAESREELETLKAQVESAIAMIDAGLVKDDEHGYTFAVVTPDMVLGDFAIKRISGQLD